MQEFLSSPNHLSDVRPLVAGPFWSDDRGEGTADLLAATGRSRGCAPTHQNGDPRSEWMSGATPIRSRTSGQRSWSVQAEREATQFKGEEKEKEFRLSPLSLRVRPSTLLMHPKERRGERATIRRTQPSACHRVSVPTFAPQPGMGQASSVRGQSPAGSGPTWRATCARGSVRPHPCGHGTGACGQSAPRWACMPHYEERQGARRKEGLRRGQRRMSPGMNSLA